MEELKREILEIVHDTIVFNDPKIIEEELIKMEK